MQYFSNCASLACARKFETLRSLYIHALLILGESFKSKKWSFTFYEQGQFEDPITNT